MPSVAAPFGIQPAFHPSGTIRPEVATIASAYNTSILQYAPVRIAADGTIEIAAVDARAVGVFLGCTYYDATGRFVLSNQWIANTALLANTVCTAYFTRDPAIRYRVQASGTLAITTMGQQFDWTVATNGSTGTGLSSVALDIGSSAANAGLRIVGLSEDVDNAWGDTFVNVIVEFSEHQDVADVAAY